MITITNGGANHVVCSTSVDVDIENEDPRLACRHNFRACCRLFCSRGISDADGDSSSFLAAAAVGRFSSSECAELTAVVSGEQGGAGGTGTLMSWNEADTFCQETAAHAGKLGKKNLVFGRSQKLIAEHTCRHLLCKQRRLQIQQSARRRKQESSFLVCLHLWIRPTLDRKSLRGRNDVMPMLPLLVQNWFRTCLTSNRIFVFSDMDTCTMVTQVRLGKQQITLNDL
jgi:hypothetical protein